MIGLLDALKIGAGAILGAALFAAPAYLYGVKAGKTAAATAALEKTVEILRERKLTDEMVSGMSDDDLCRALGGVLNDGRCE